MGRILVTGAAGFIGSHVTKELLNREYQVVAADSLSDYYSIELKQMRIAQFDNHKNLKFERLDISDFTKVEKLFLDYRFDGVIHLAAQAGVRLPLNQSGRYIDTNIIGFYNVLRKTIELKIPNFIYASSSSVYGDLSPLPYSESSKLLSPKSFYGATKLNNEQTASILAAETEISTRGLRFFTVYGPWGRPDMAYFRLMATALGKHHFKMFGDGSVERDFTYIDDVTEVFYRSSFKKISNITLNLCSSNPVKMIDIVNILKKRINKKFDILYLQKRKGEMLKTYGSNKKIKTIFNKKKYMKLSSGVNVVVKKFSKIEKELSLK